MKNGKNSSVQLFSEQVLTPLGSSATLEKG